MKIKMISSLVLAGLIAFGAQAEEFTGGIYIKNATIAPGGTVRLSVQMENNIPVRGFHLTMTLPEGVTVVDCSLSEDRLPDGLTPNDKFDLPVSEGSKFMWPCTLFKGTQLLSFKDTSGEIATIKIKAEPTVLEDTYTIALTDLVVSDPEGNDIHIDDSNFTLTIGAISYDEGYGIEVLPFAYKEELEMPITIDNLTAITNIALDLELPSALVNGKLYYIDNPLGRKFNVVDNLSLDGTVHVTINRSKPSNKIDEGSGTEVVILGFEYEDGAISAGVYPISITDIQMTDVDGNTYLAAPYTTEIFVGEAPKATVTDGVVAFHGNYGGATEFALLKAALPTGATIDLTEVSAMAEDATALQTDNVIVTSDAVAYGRAVSNVWGTLCLPFAINSDDNIQLYEMSGASSDALSFEKVASAAANTPLVFKAAGDGFSIKTTKDESFDVNYSAANPSVQITPSVTDWIVNGSFIEEPIDVNRLGAQAYALNSGKFLRATSIINVKPFRAWFQHNGAPMGAAIRIEEGTDGIDFVEQEDGSVKLIYDMQGRLLKNGEHQQMYIENGKKVISNNK